MKHILTALCSVLLCLPLGAQHSDPIVMTVNGYDVKSSEFEYFLKKNHTGEKIDSKKINQYANLYLNFKLKVAAAIDEGMEENSAFVEEYGAYREMQAWNYVVDTAYLENVAKLSYQSSVENVGSDGLVSLSLIVLTPEDENDEASINETIELMISIHEMLDAGQSFNVLAKKYSMDVSAQQGGNVGWVSRSQMPDDIADIVFGLDVDSYSEPFYADGSLYIVKAGRRKYIGTYEESRPEIYNWMMSQDDLIAEAKTRKAREYATKLNWDVTDDVAVARLDSLLEEIEPDFAHISREYHDGLLLFDVSNKEVWEKATIDTLGREQYFKSHIKDYKFQNPAFRGMVFFCTNENVFRQVESQLEGVNIKNWTEKIIKFNKEDLQLRVMRGPVESNIFMKGDNAYVDKLVFGEGEFEPMNGFPYVNVIGYKLSEPESMLDVNAQLTEDYQNHLEEIWVNSLKKRYDYKIYNKVLKQLKP